jgi:hypothetical protein
MIYPVLQPWEHDRKLWILHETFQLGTRFGLLRIMPGFLTDGASIPRIAWPFSHPFGGDVISAALLHDGLYSAKIVYRFEADLVLLDTMRAYHVNTIKAPVIYGAVRLGGWVPWCRRKASSARAARRYVHLYRDDREVNPAFLPSIQPAF